MWHERLALTSVALSSTVAGWSAYHIQQARLARRFRAHNVTDYRATLDHGQLHYWAGGRGDGKPLLLLHGFGADALFGWGEQYRLAHDHFLIAPDLLWFGESHSHASNFTPLFQAEAMVQLLDHLAIDKVDVVGISYGGFVAGELANAFPDRIDRLVMVDSPGFTYTMDDYHEAMDRLGLDSVADLVAPESASGVRRLVQLAYYRPPPLPMFVARDLYAHMYVRWKREKVRLLDNLLTMANQVGPEDYDIQADTLLLWGEHDELFPVHLAHRLAAAASQKVEIGIIPRANHAPNMERADIFDARLRAFLHPA